MNFKSSSHFVIGANVFQDFVGWSAASLLHCGDRRDDHVGVLGSGSGFLELPSSLWLRLYFGRHLWFLGERLGDCRRLKSNFQTWFTAFIASEDACRMIAYTLVHVMGSKPQILVARDHLCHFHRVYAVLPAKLGRVLVVYSVEMIDDS